MVHLHGADYNEALVPFNYVPETGSAPRTRDPRGLASCFAVGYHLRALPAAKSKSVPPVGTTYAVTADGTLYWECASRGIPATMIEAGKEGKADDETVSIHYDGLVNVMRHMGILPGGAEYHEDVKILKNPVLVANRSAGLFIPQVKSRRGRSKGRAPRGDMGPPGQGGREDNIPRRRDGRLSHQLRGGGLFPHPDAAVPILRDGGRGKGRG